MKIIMQGVLYSPAGMPGCSFKVWRASDDTHTVVLTSPFYRARGDIVTQAKDLIEADVGRLLLGKADW